MSQKNVDLLRASYEAFNRQEIESVVSELFAPDFEFTPAGKIPGVEGIYRGPDGFRQFLTFFWGAFDESRVDIGELRHSGDHVLAETTNRGRGKHSGIPTAWTVWIVWTIRDGKVVRGQAFVDRAEALTAAGLPD